MVQKLGVLRICRYQTQYFNAFWFPWDMGGPFHTSILYYQAAN